MQTFSDFEFIIIDDGSNKQSGCAKILEEYTKKDSRIKIIKNGINIGLTKTLNKGLAIVQGTYIARIDSDDIALPDRLASQYLFLEQNPGIDLCGSWIELIDENNKTIAHLQPPTNHATIREQILRGNVFNHSSWFFRASLIDEVGPYSEQAIKTEDYEFILRIIPKHHVAIIPKFLCEYRINNDGISFKNNKEQEWHALKVRWVALKTYDYKMVEWVNMIRPTLIFLFIPFWLKKRLYKILIWK